MFRRRPFQSILFFVATFVSTFFIFSLQTYASPTLPRNINQYKELFGKNFNPSDEEIRSGSSGGILYLGPQTQNNNGFDADGNLKKIRAIVSLNISDDAFRPWNMVNGQFEQWADYLRNKTYLRFLDQSFAVRIYQKDGSGNIINQTIVYPENSSFIRNKDDESKLATNKPLNYIFKYTSGSAFFADFFGDGRSDGYNTDPNSSSVLFFLNSTGSVLAKKQTAVIDLPITNTNLEKGKPAYMDFWYLGSARETTAGDTELPAGYPDIYLPTPGDERIIDLGYTNTGRKFSYFKIGKTVDFITPSTFNDALSQAYTATATAESVNSNLSTNRGSMPVCGILNGFLDTGGSFMGCVGLLSYYGLFKPATGFAWIMGKIFDFFIGYSLSDESYRLVFVETAWRLVRDISNIFFIIIMIWTGLAAVFSTSNVSWKKVIPTLIVNAIIINFSLFATRLIIDISNITARLFYNRIEVCQKDSYGNCVEEVGVAGFKPISESILSSFNPQKLFSDSKLLAPDDNLVAEKDTGTNAGDADFNGSSQKEQQTERLSAESNRYGAYFAFVSLLMAVVAFGTGMMFWKTAFMFVGRVIGLYVAMIFSPFAFLSRGGVPIVSSVPSISYSSWLKDLTGYALLAPIFVFFLYIIGAFLQLNFLEDLGLSQSGTNFFETVMLVAIPMLLIYGLIDQGVGIAKRFAGKYGEMAQNLANKATGLVAGAALGVASGGMALAGTRAAGLLKMSETSRAALAAKKAEGGIAGRFAGLRLGLNDRAQTASFDFRKTKAFSGVGNITGRMGAPLSDKVSGVIGLGDKATEGGIAGINKRDKKKAEEAAKKKIEAISTDMKDADAQKFWKEKAAALIEKEKAALLKDEDALIAAHKANKKTDDEIEQMKKDNTLKNDVAALAQKKIDSYGTVENNKQLTQALRIQYADTLASQKNLGQKTMEVLGGGAGLAVASTIGAGGIVGAPVAMLGAYEQARKRRLDKGAFEDYAKKARKDGGKPKREERLEAQKKEIELELEQMDSYTQSIKEELSSAFDELVQKAKNGNLALKSLKDRDVGSYGKEPTDRKFAADEYRKTLEAEAETLDLDIKRTDQEYGMAKRAGKTEETEKLKDLRADLAKRRVENEQLMRYTDEEKRKKLEADFDKKESELEKIKERNNESKK